MKIQSLRPFALVLVCTGLVFSVGGLAVRMVARPEFQVLTYFGIVFVVMGVGFQIIDRNIAELARRIEGGESVGQERR